MAWKGRTTGQQDFNQLIKSLDNSGVQKKNNALYQVIYQLVQAAQRNKDLTVTQINELSQNSGISITNITNITANLAAILASTVITWTDESALFANSRQLLAGTGITFDDTVPNERTINSSGGGSGSYIPLSLGIEPLTFVSDGLGQPILVPFIP